MNDIDYSTATYKGTITIDAETLFLLTMAAQHCAIFTQLPDNQRDEYMSLYHQGLHAVSAAVSDGSVILS